MGALLLGNQRLADPLRDLIDQHVNISAVRAGLMAGGTALATAVMTAWQHSQKQHGHKIPIKPGG